MSTKLKIVNKPVNRTDARGKVTGKTKYAADMKFNNTTYGVPVYTRYPHAEIVSINTEKALKLPGIIAVLTHKDIPGKNLFGVVIKNQQLFAEDKARYFGDVVAMVVAESEDAAAKAVDSVEVEYKVLPGVFSIEDAMKKEAPLIHSEGNVAFKHIVRKGSVKDAFKKADIILEKKYKTQFIEHSYIEPEGVSAFTDHKGGVEVHGSIQNPYSARVTVASVLGLPLNKVRIVQTPLGGSFGGKDENMQALGARAALAAEITGRPCKIVYTRENSIKESYKRHPYIINYKVGAKKNGALAALEVEVYAEAGAYASMSPFVTWRSTVQCGGPYVIENVHADIYGVYTNNVYTGAMRGFGSPQINFAIESLMDELAENLGMSPLDIRKKNCLKDNSITTTGQKLTQKVALPECIERTTKTINYEKKLSEYAEFNKKSKVLKKGIGLACSFRGCSLGAEGKDYAGAILAIQSDGSVVLSSGIAENGQGAQTVMSQIAAEVLGVSMDRIHFMETDTSTTVDSGPTVASRGTIMGGGAVKDAAEKARDTILETASRMIGVPKSKLSIENNKVFVIGNKRKSIGFDKVIFECIQRRKPICFVGWFKAPDVSWDEEVGQGDAYFTYVYGTDIAEVEVDTETGKVKVTNFVSANDVGCAINPQMARGQLYGGIAMGMGYALLEEVETNKGWIKNDNLDEYIIATSLDMPEIESILVEYPDKAGPFGAKSLGEPAVEIVAPAITNAVCQAIGRRIYELPANLEVVLLGKKLKKK